MRAFKKFNIDVGQNFSERRLCSRVWKNGKMTEVNVAQEVLAAGQKRARDFAALLGIEHPVLNAPMPVEAGVELVAAVSEAGGLGVLSSAGRTPDEVSQTVVAIRARTNKPFAIHLELPAKSLNSQELDAAKMLAEGLAPLFESLGLPNPTSAKGAEIYDFSGEQRRAHFEAVFERVLELNPAAVVATFGGLREPEADALRDARISNIATATTLHEAKVLRAAHCDAIVVQGSEAAGPRSSFEDADDTEVGLSSLIPAVAAATKLPVIAAGGLCSAEQALGAVLMGASAVMAGTAFLTTVEAHTSAYSRSAALWAAPQHLVRTRLYSGRLTQALRSPLLDALTDYAPHMPPWPAATGLMSALQQKAVELGRNDLEAVYFGQSVGRSAAHSAEDMVLTLARFIS